jgi:hypothetical protein
MTSKTFKPSSPSQIDVSMLDGSRVNTRNIVRRRLPTSLFCKKNMIVLLIFTACFLNPALSSSAQTDPSQENTREPASSGVDVFQQKEETKCPLCFEPLIESQGVIRTCQTLMQPRQHSSCLTCSISFLISTKNFPKCPLCRAPGYVHECIEQLTFRLQESFFEEENEGARRPRFQDENVRILIEAFNRIIANLLYLIGNSGDANEQVYLREAIGTAVAAVSEVANLQVKRTGGTLTEELHQEDLHTRSSDDIASNGQWSSSFSPAARESVDGRRGMDVPRNILSELDGSFSSETGGFVREREQGNEEWADPRWWRLPWFEEVSGTVGTRTDNEVRAATLLKHMNANGCFLGFDGRFSHPDSPCST